MIPLTPFDPAPYDPDRNLRVVSMDHHHTLPWLNRAANWVAGLAIGALPICAAIYWGWL